MNKQKNMSANDFYRLYTGTEKYYKFYNHFLTDGVFDIAGEEECFWFLQIIVIAQRHLKEYLFQTWKLERIMNNEFSVIATDGNDFIIYRQNIAFSDFFFDSLTIWVENEVVMLPSER